MKKIIFCMCFCFLFIPSIAFGSPKEPDNAQPAKPITQQAIDENSIAGSKDPDIVPMARGCCSWHKGVCDCENGRTVCCDGTYSPTCGC